MYILWIKGNESKTKRGEKMEGLIFALVALILLIPVLISLPLGLNIRGKFSLIVVSFLIAILGILANYTFSLGQSFLMVVLLALLASYVLDKRLGRKMFIPVEKEKKAVVAENKFNIESPAELEEKTQIFPESFQEQAEKNQTHTITSEKEEHKSEPYVEEMALLNVDSIDEENIKNNNKADSDEKLDEDITFLLNRDQLYENSIEETANDSIQTPHTQEINYMEEIEKMLETENEIDEWIEDKDEQVQESTLNMKNEDFSIANNSNNQLDHQNSRSKSSKTFDVELEEIHFEDSHIGENQNQDYFSETNDIEKNMDSTWEEDEIQPLSFDDNADSLKASSRVEQEEKTIKGV